MRFVKDLDSIAESLHTPTDTLAAAKSLTRVVVNGDCVPPNGHQRLTGKYNDLQRIYTLTKNVTEFLASNEAELTFHPIFPNREDEMCFEKLDESDVRIEWAYSLSDYEHTAVVNQNALGSELLAAGREYVAFARDVVFPHTEENPLWAREYGVSHGIDRPHIDELEALLNELATQYD